jgi:hypothetical protein
VLLVVDVLTRVDGYPVVTPERIVAPARGLVLQRTFVESVGESSW